MKISKIEVNNFRLLNDFVLTPEDELSLIIGKNNTAKTSLLTVLDKFINYQEVKNFTFNDLSIEHQKILKAYILSSFPSEEMYSPTKISLKIYITYSDNDDISRISALFVDLIPENNTVVISYEYILSYENLHLMKSAFENSLHHSKKKKSEPVNDASALDKFLENGIGKFFKLEIKSIQYDQINTSLLEDSYIPIESTRKLNDILAFKYISAKRDVSNKNNNSVLSQQIIKIFDANKENDAMQDAFRGLSGTLVSADGEISAAYGTIFEDIAGIIKRFGGIAPGDTQIQVVSNLRPGDLLKNNATVVYQHAGQNLPEHYNGLGYMNLFSILFELDAVLSRIRRNKSEVPADINLLFIEEPEAHTHPQMQYIFIKNIKHLMQYRLVRDDGIKVNLQYFISTHSAHIVANCDFDDIKYLKRTPSGVSVEAKNIQELQDIYEKDGDAGKAAYKFLKQYLTINCSELFFTEKAIFVEGDSERIILPSMMKKLDKKHTAEPPLLSQNISIVDGAGSHSKIFAKFIEFIGLKSLIITDIDTYYDAQDSDNKPIHHACPSCDVQARYTWNSSLRFFHCRGDDMACQYFLGLDASKKTIGYDPTAGTWQPMTDGNIFTAYQCGVSGAYAGCSFEDAFIEENKDFILEHGDCFESLRPKWFVDFKQTKNSFSLAQKGIIKKSAFALDLLLHEPEIITEADNTPKNVWSVPLYIEEGLEWLRKL